MRWTLGHPGETGVTKEVFPGDGNTVLDKGGTGLSKEGGNPPAVHSGGSDGLEEVPDGGWGWVVVFGCFLIWVLLGSASAIFGILFAEFLRESHTSSTTTAWIHNLAFMLSCYCTYMLDPLVEEYGWRRVAFTMGAMRSVGLALSTFAPSPYFLFFSYTILAGIPIDVLYSLSFSIIPHYFSRRRNIANTLMSVGSSVSMLSFPLFVTFLQQHLGYKAAILITAAISLNLCVAAMVFHPVEWHSKNRVSYSGSGAGKPIAKLNTDSSAVCRSLRRVADIAKTNLQLIRSPSVVIVSLAASINLLGLTNFDYLVPFAIQAAGHDVDNAGLCFTLAGLCLLVARLVHPFLMTWLTHKTVFISGSTILATSVLVFAWADDLLIKAAMMGAFGSGTGLVFSSYNLVMVEVLGLSMLQPTLSITGLFNGVLFLIFGPFVGFVRDMSGSYKVSMSVLSGLLYTSVLLWALLPAAIVFDQRKDQQTNKDEEHKHHQQKPLPPPPCLSSNERRPLLPRLLP